jgi:hypothetical protein
MGKRYDALNDKHVRFIADQRIFFVGTAAPQGRVNVSPKGMDSLRVLNRRRLAWLNLTGSGNETAAHVQDDPRMTLMFCAFADEPLILRVYGNARVIHPRDPDWRHLASLFAPLPGARQIFDLAVDLVQTSCGMGVPRYAYESDRPELRDWALRKGETGIRQYWETKNQRSLDGLPTHIIPGED